MKKIKNKVTFKYMLFGLTLFTAITSHAGEKKERKREVKEKVITIRPKRSMEILGIDLKKLEDIDFLTYCCYNFEKNNGMLYSSYYEGFNTSDHNGSSNELETARAIFKNKISAILEKPGNTLVDEKNTGIGNFIGKEVTIYNNATKTTNKLQMYVSKNTIYTIHPNSEFAQEKGKAQPGFLFRPESESNNPVSYHISTTKYPEGVTNSSSGHDVTSILYQNSIAKYIHEINGELLSELDVPIDGITGKEILVRNKKNNALSLTYLVLVKNKMYVIHSIEPTPSQKQAFSVFNNLK